MKIRSSGVTCRWNKRLLGPGGFDSALARLRKDAPFLSAEESWRLVRDYGSRAWTIIGDARGPADLGESFGGA